MIKFFQHIRRSLIQENKMGKYFKYAIGEILLVVIGILIALQLSSWKESNNNHKYVSLLLKEIYYDLSDDYRIIYKGVEPRINRKINSVKKVKEFMTGSITPSDSTFMKYYEGMKQSFLLSQRTGAFESIKLGGLDKIDNDSLRTRLLEFYESDIPRALEFIYGRYDQINNRVMILEDDLFHNRFITTENGEKIQIEFPKTQDYLNHQSLHKIYSIYQWDSERKNTRIKYLKRDYNKIMSMLEKELILREVDFEVFDTTGLERNFLGNQ